ncbi:hypothetical protein ACU635_32275 [[Actinomadura] parvosata]|uniref:hypothetical protein n=1 Tax=[Actinomadura] parvosata TaxID=1955412 RepID=UPI00406BE956
MDHIVKRSPGISGSTRPDLVGHEAVRGEKVHRRGRPHLVARGAGIADRRPGSAWRLIWRGAAGARSLSGLRMAEKWVIVPSTTSARKTPSSWSPL